MKVISFGTDRNLFLDNSQVLERAIQYAEKTEEYNVVVFSLARNKHKEISIGKLRIYPTNSISRFHYINDAFKIAINKIFINIDNKKDWVLTSQDPFETGLSAYLVKRKTGIPLQVQVHTDFLDKHFRNNFLNIIRIFIGKFILRKADGIRVVSSTIKESIQKKISKLKVDPVILPIWVDIPKIINFEPVRDIKKDFPQFKFIIMMASRLAYEKRIDVAIKAMKEIVKKYPHTGLVICGSGPEKRKLQALANYLKIEKSVVFAGWQEDLISYFKTANLFLLTSEYEGYGMTLIEAGASGCPIVTTRVGIAKTDLFQDGVNSEICKFFDYNCVAESVLSVISNNSKRELFKHKMQDTIRGIMTPKEEYVSKYVSLLESLTVK